MPSAHGYFRFHILTLETFQVMKCLDSFAFNCFSTQHLLVELSRVLSNFDCVLINLVYFEWYYVVLMATFHARGHHRCLLNWIMDVFDVIRHFIGWFCVTDFLFFFLFVVCPKPSLSSRQPCTMCLLHLLFRYSLFHSFSVSTIIFILDSNPMVAYKH